MTDSVWRFLFEQLGRDLGASFPLRELSDFDPDEVRLARTRGVFRELPLTVTPCGVRGCPESCDATVLPAAAGQVRVVCPRGVIDDRVTPQGDIAVAEVVTERMLQQFTRCNEVEFQFDRFHGAGRVVPFGRIPWLDGTTVCLAVGLGRHDATGALTAAAALGRGPFLVLLPPRADAVRFDAERLDALGIRVITMDAVMDWPNLELRRAQLHVAAAANEVRESQAPYGETDLVLDADHCQAFFHGQELKLTRLQFGFLLALAKSPGQVVRSDVIADIAYAYQGELRNAASRQEGGVGQLAKIKRALKKALSEAPAKGSDNPAAWIKSRSGVGYQLCVGSVLIR